MIRKTMLLALSAGLLVAFAAPTVAGAQLLTESGSTLPAGSQVTATSSNLKVTTSGGTIECANITIHAEVTSNKATTSALESASYAVSNCGLNQTEGERGHIPTLIESAAMDLHFTIVEAGTATFTFNANVGPGLTVCHYEGALVISYSTNSNKFHLEGGMTGIGSGCPPVTLAHGDFLLETSNGAPVTID